MNHTILVELPLNRCRLDSWLELDENGTIIGMGRNREYDKDGALIKDETYRTGVTASFQ